MKKYSKALIICPDFENEHLNFENFFRYYGLDVNTILYKENVFAKKIGLLYKILLKIVNYFSFYEVYKNLRYKREEFNDFLIENSIGKIDSETIVIFVKPFILNDGVFLDLMKKKSGCLIFYSYDTYERYPIAKKIMAEKNITFDIGDAIKYKWKYSPVPRSNSLICYRSKNSSVIFYGSFSFYRLLRVFVAKLIFHNYGIKFHSYLMHEKFNKNINICGVFLGGKVRRVKSNCFVLDIPQKRQAGGSFRSQDPKDLVFSYSYVTPKWRFLDMNSLISFSLSINKISEIFNSGNLEKIYFEEHLSTYRSFNSSIQDLIGVVA